MGQIGRQVSASGCVWAPASWLTEPMKNAEVDRKAHWEQVYVARKADETSWFQPVPTLSLGLIDQSGVNPNAPVIDVGGGASLLVDHLLQMHFVDITVLDISAAALQRARQRLGPLAKKVRWIESDITCFAPDRHYALWHDRAAFHFLTRQADREKYVAVMLNALSPGGHAILATFAPDGPEKCSGLDVVRYNSSDMQAQLGSGMRLMQQQRDTHTTPLGGEQRFAFYLFERVRNS